MEKVEFKVLFLGIYKHFFPNNFLTDLGVELVSEFESKEMYRTLFGFRVSLWSIEQARDLATNGFSAAIIGNNLGTGIEKAREIPEKMRGSTMIAFNNISSPENKGDIEVYKEIGFRNFGNKYQDIGNPNVLTVNEFLGVMARKLVSPSSVG